MFITLCVGWDYIEGTITYCIQLPTWHAALLLVNIMNCMAGRYLGISRSWPKIIWVRESQIKWWALRQSKDQRAWLVKTFNWVKSGDVSLRQGSELYLVCHQGIIRAILTYCQHYRKEQLQWNLKKIRIFSLINMLFYRPRCVNPFAPPSWQEDLPNVCFR